MVRRVGLLGLLATSQMWVKYHPRLLPFEGMGSQGLRKPMQLYFISYKFSFRSHTVTLRISHIARVRYGEHIKSYIKFTWLVVPICIDTDEERRKIAEADLLIVAYQPVFNCIPASLQTWIESVFDLDQPFSKIYAVSQPSCHIQYMSRSLVYC